MDIEFTAFPRAVLQLALLQRDVGAILAAVELNRLGPSRQRVVGGVEDRNLGQALGGAPVIIYFVAVVALFQR